MGLLSPLIAGATLPLCCYEAALTLEFRGTPRGHSRSCSSSVYQVLPLLRLMPMVSDSPPVLSTRLQKSDVEYILEHSGAKLILDRKSVV